MAVYKTECRIERIERGDIDLTPLAATLRERGFDALTVRDLTGIQLPKVLRLLGITHDERRGTELNGYEVVQLAALADIPLSAIVKGKSYDAY